jgi:hypothetical protein
MNAKQGPRVSYSCRLRSRAVDMLVVVFHFKTGPFARMLEQPTQPKAIKQKNCHRAEPQNAREPQLQAETWFRRAIAHRRVFSFQRTASPPARPRWQSYWP